MGSVFLNTSASEYHDPTIDKLASYLEQTLNITDNQTQFIDSPTVPSDCEVSRKLEMESETYCRWSKLHAHQNDAPSTTSSNETNDEESFGSFHNGRPVSSSQFDNTGCQSRLTDEETEPKLMRLFTFPAERNILYPNEVEMESTDARLSKDELPQIAKSLETSSVEILDSPVLIETLPVNVILDLWERSKIPRGRAVLLALGFDTDYINLSQLNKAMEEIIPKICHHAEKLQMIVMKACLPLQSTEMTTLGNPGKQLDDENTNQMSTLGNPCKQLHDESRKQMVDNKEAKTTDAAVAVNDRHHTSLEEETNQEVHSLEQRHAGVVSDDSENSSTFTRDLKHSSKPYELDDLKLVRTDKEDLESNRYKMQTKFTAKNIESQCESSEKNESKYLEQCNDTDETAATFKAQKSPQIPDLTCNPNTITKRKGDRDIESDIENPHFSKFRKCYIDNTSTCCEYGDTMGKWMAINSVLNTQSIMSIQAQALEKIIAEYKEQTQEVKGSEPLPSPSSSVTTEEGWQIYVEDPQKNLPNDERLSPTAELQSTNCESEAEQMRENARKEFKKCWLEFRNGNIN